MSIEYLDADTAIFKETDGGFLSLQIGRKKPYKRVHLYRMFPLSEPDKYISVRDDEEEEIGIIETLADYSVETAKIIGEEIERRYFSPMITRLVKLKEEFGYTYWDAETDSGMCRFTVKGGGTNIIQISQDTLLVIDVDGNRFMFPEFENTDAKYLKIIDTML